MRLRNWLIEEYSRYLDIQDKDAVDILLATAVNSLITNRGYPIWMMVVAPSSSGKTQLAWFPFQQWNDHIYNLNDITPHTFVTGLKSGKDLLPRLENKLVLMQDMSGIMTMRPDSAIVVFSQLRQIFDGFYSSHFGSTKSSSEYRGIKFNMICCTTPDSMEKSRLFTGALGERFLSFRLRFNRKNIAKLSRRNESTEQRMNNTLQEVFLEFIHDIEYLIPSYSLLNDDNSSKDTLTDLCTLTGELRTTVQRDIHHVMIDKASKESPGRIVSSMMSLSRSLAIVYAHDMIGEEELNICRRLCYDMVQPSRMVIIEILLRGRQSIIDMSDLTRIPHSTIKRILEDMWSLNILGKVEEKSTFYYSVEDALRTRLNSSGLLKGGIITQYNKTENICDIIYMDESLAVDEQIEISIDDFLKDINQGL